MVILALNKQLVEGIRLFLLINDGKGPLLFGLALILRPIRIQALILVKFIRAILAFLLHFNG